MIYLLPNFIKENGRVVEPIKLFGYCLVNSESIVLINKLIVFFACSLENIAEIMIQSNECTLKLLKTRITWKKNYYL